MKIYKVYVFVKNITITNINSHSLSLCTYKVMFETNILLKSHFNSSAYPLKKS